jgi:hypothetical protein
MSENEAQPATAAPLHYAVLVLVPARGIGVKPSDVDFVESLVWGVHYANGELAAARVKAEEWAMFNPGQQAVVVQYVDHVHVEPQTKWAKA